MPRLTASLLKQSRRWQMRNEWARKGVFWDPKLIIPPAITEKGVDLVDPVLKYMTPVKPARWVPPVPDPRFVDPPTELEHPDYHEEPVYCYQDTSHANTRIFEATKQAQLLTKSQLMTGLPSSVQRTVGAVHIPNQDELVQRYIMQAHRWDPTQEKLPARSTHLPIWKFKAEVGIPQSKIASILLQNVLRLCMTTNGQFPELLSSRRHLQDHHYSATYQHQGKPIQILNTCEWLSTSNKPLTPFADEMQVIDTVAHELPDIFPIAPTIDLKKIHVFKEDNISGFSPGYVHCHPHTLFLSNNEQWLPDEWDARAIMLCFGQALALAHHKYGADVTDLPEPICVQCVNSDGIAFHFAAFQLNTLDCSSMEGIKNLAWIDSDNKMFEKIIPKRGMLRSTRYEDYDPLVFQKLLAVYLNGVAIS